MTSFKDEILDEAKHDAKELTETARTKVSLTTSHMQAEAIEALAPFRDVGRNFENAIYKSAKDQPAATIAVFATMGFILGALWKA